ncbi:MULTISPECIES: molybdenum cofactor guanylyltransferase [Micromonospora]|uniref:Bifunctional protein IspD/ispF n=1 Tax=Micromonospora solifontis TaxID=2487138 RepID=A0ABX9WKI3_9ACTN|nr:MULTISPECIES: NTP transferase domain-containing protein [Micromonospora]NES16387.1 NTP transferase domain-containing protein [Micromonospora sp. PPF5-17B]NES36237.1 NTP transferase domain-containing protein [Micromonospora solifontis]NES57988.1 NTP transferase domain-containing protein [Micromonospora sp. PPF5-6]RNL99825.1 bifunctional protein IspD/ispF [Micromonospora solifontis]
MTAYAAVVLSGGTARRMGGVDKPARPVGGRPMLHRVLAAVADAEPRLVVGPAGPVPDGVRVTREEPPGGGPVAATAAGLALLDPGTPTVALLAADLPLLTPAAVVDLRRALDGSTADGACYVDDDGRRQQLCGVWRVAALRAAVERLAAERDGSVDGAPVRRLLAGLAVREVSWSGSGPPPWFDCDTDEDVRRAEEWTR